jgi:hypothetical protein
MIVMEDGASGHKSAYSDELYISWEVVRMLWPANSPDLNRIERIIKHIKQVILLEGGNHYKEGCLKGQLKQRVY